MKTVKLKDKEFKVSINSEQIQEAVKNIANNINKDFDNEPKTPLFVSILNGSFMFTADLFKNLTINCEVSFLKLASYKGTESTGSVKQLIGFNENVKGRKIIVLEDIVDSGVTLEKIVAELKKFEPAEIKIATLLYKPDSYKKDIPVDYIGIKIPNDFIVGYGLDYDGLGRNLSDIYTVI